MKQSTLNKIIGASAMALSLATVPSHAANIIENGGFEDGTALPWQVPGWWAGGSGSSAIDSEGRMCVTVDTEGSADWGAQLRQVSLPFVGGDEYTVRFKAWSSAPVSIQASAMDEDAGFVWIFGESAIVIDAPLDGAAFDYEASFVAAADSDNANFRFLLGGGNVPAGETICIDDVEVNTPEVNLLTNSDFEDGSTHPWEEGAWDGSEATFDVTDGRMCVAVSNPGNNDWSLQFRENDLTFVAGHSYSFSADAWSSAPVSIGAAGVDESSGFTWHFGSNFDIDAPLDGEPQQITASFTNGGGNTDSGKFRFTFGEGLVPAGETVCLDNIQLLDPNPATIVEDGPVPVFVNQHAYLPQLSKKATYAVPADIDDKTTPRTWTLMSGDAVVASGSTTDFGDDASSGDHVHIIDFSSVSTEGGDYTIVVEEGDELFTSYPFAISADAYDQVKYDALAYFYHNRSGEPILEEVVGADHARGAGHLNDAMLQTIECRDDPSHEYCRYVNGFGGWYDAGDHGKYVVNGGISVWTLLNQYERSYYQGLNQEYFADGQLMLPADEGSNGVPDILDEVRVELEWMLNMQVPEGHPRAGLAYHKMHDEWWTGTPTDPSNVDVPRWVFQPSTAATLNLAAVSAMCSRIYRPYDQEFANRCLDAAKLAYEAAKANPDIDAPSWGSGGGIYGDGDRSDEFYWAAAELFLAMNNLNIGSLAAAYQADLIASHHHLSIGDTPSSLMYWGGTSALGMMSMAVVGTHDYILDANLRVTILDAADIFKTASENEGYGLPYEGVNANWGSNSSVLNNMIVLGLANDFDCEGTGNYVEAINDGMNYLLGRNPLSQSYVTGYGEQATTEPHHRFWANAVSAEYPAPPAGVLAGGPNRGLEDPLAQSRLAGCAPLKCYVDDIESWSTNEITINWNAPLAWAAAYLDEVSDNVGTTEVRDSCAAPNPYLITPEEADDIRSHDYWSFLVDYLPF